MAEAKLQKIRITSGKAKKITKKWDELPFAEMVEKVKKLAGPKPEIPPEGDAPVWTEQALRVLKERYFLKDAQGKPIETTEEMCWRVAWELASAEVKYGWDRKQVMKEAKEFYRQMLNRWFLPNSPTLMNAGKGNGLQYSACYVLPVPDSLDGIFDGVKYQGLIHQSGGGTGFSFSKLRPKGSRVKSTMGVASGPVSFMRIYNEATQQVKQGGMRRGANMGILRVDHPDIMEFIHCKEDGGITNFNISVTITDKFMKALAKDEDYELVSPHNNEVVGKLSARKVWSEIAEGAWRTGDPGLVFIDRINDSSANPIRAEGWEVESTNPCVIGETLISTGEGLVRMDAVVNSHMKGGSRFGENMPILWDKRVKELETEGTSMGRAVKFFDNGIKEVLKMTTAKGFELVGTYDHQVMTPEGWKKLEVIQKNDTVFIQSGQGEFGKNFKLQIADLDENFPTEWSYDLGKIVGWLVGDGWLRVGDKNCRVGFVFGRDDKEIADDFAKILNKWYGKDIQSVKRARNTWHLSYHGKGLVNFFERLGVKAVKAEFKEVPEKIFSAPKEVVVGFLQGLFTADGTVSYQKGFNAYVRLTSKSRKMLGQVQLLLLNMGIISTIYDRSRKPRSGMFGYVNKFGDRKTYTLDGKLYELQISKQSVKRFLDEVGFLAEKHSEKIAKFSAQNFYKDNFYDKVVKVEKAGRQRVYDLTEESSLTFITNGIVSLDCGEQPLYPFDACNLGSIFLNYYVKDGKVEWEKLSESVHLAVRMLDNVIEMNPFPLPQIASTVRKIRRIGLGIGGWADMLVGLGIPYDSDEALELAEKIMKFINEEGHAESQILAKERGTFPLWDLSVYADAKRGKIEKLRNSTVTTIAPTGSIGILANTSGGCEPLFAIAYQHIVKSEGRTLTFVNPLFEKVARERGFYSEELMNKVAEHGTVRHLTEVPEDVRRVFGTAHEIDPEWHVRMQAAFQKYTDNGVSKTINLRNEATVEDVKKAYMLAWETGCRGITVFRDGCKGEQVLNLGTTQEKKPVEAEVVIKHEQVIRPRPVRVEGATYRIETPLGSAFITVNHDEDGNPFEVFVTIGKAGSEVAAMAEALGRLISTTLRFGNHMPPKERAKELMDQLAGIGGGRSVGFGANKVKSLPDAVGRAIGMHFGLVGFGAEKKEKMDQPQQQELQMQTPTNGHTQMPLFRKRADLCPKCGEATLVFEEGCKKCYGCGYSEC